jgi:hypothetical protein
LVFGPSSHVVERVFHPELVQSVASNSQELNFYIRSKRSEEGEILRHDRSLRPKFKSVASIAGVIPIVNKCPLLKLPKLTYVDLSEREDLMVNTSLETLTIEYINFNNKTLPSLSRCVPSLKYMVIAGFSTAITGQDNGIYFVNIPDTSFHTLTWKDGFYSRSDEKRYGLPIIYLKVSTIKGDKYFIFNDSGAKKVCSEGEIDSCTPSIVSKKAATPHYSCSLQEFKVHPKKIQLRNRIIPPLLLNQVLLAVINSTQQKSEKKSKACV